MSRQLLPIPAVPKKGTTSEEDFSHVRVTRSDEQMCTTFEIGSLSKSVRNTFDFITTIFTIAEDKHRRHRCCNASHAIDNRNNTKSEQTTPWHNTHNNSPCP